MIPRRPIDCILTIAPSGELRWMLYFPARVMPLPLLNRSQRRACRLILCLKRGYSPATRPMCGSILLQPCRAKSQRAWRTPASTATRKNSNATGIAAPLRWGRPLDWRQPKPSSASIFAEGRTMYESLARAELSPLLAGSGRLEYRELDASGCAGLVHSTTQWLAHRVRLAGPGTVFAHRRAIAGGRCAGRPFPAPLAAVGHAE